MIPTIAIIIDKNNNSVRISDQDPMGEYSYEFKKIYATSSGVSKWNNFEQKERLLSEIYHKMTYNDLVFKVPNVTFINNSSVGRYGYYYRPHNKMTLRVFSDYIEKTLSVILLCGL